MPSDVEARHLDKAARLELKTLSKDNADEVAKHLVLTARHIEEDPELAHRHAISAARRAGRIAVVRETLAITAYAIGDYSLALRELRTFRRISGSNEQLPLMVDSERGLERPDRALELGRSVDREELTVPTRVELAIAMSGARLDQEQPELALAELEIPQLDPERAFSWSPALFGAYATVLEELGRDADAERWIALAERAARALQDEVGDETIEIIDVQIDDEDAELLDAETGVRIEDEDFGDELGPDDSDDDHSDDDSDDDHSDDDSDDDDSDLADSATDDDAAEIELGEDDEPAGEESAAVVEVAVVHADPSPLSFEDDVRAEVEQLLAEDAKPDALDAIVAKAIADSEQSDVSTGADADAAVDTAPAVDADAEAAADVDAGAAAADADADGPEPSAPAEDVAVAEAPVAPKRRAPKKVAAKPAEGSAAEDAAESAPAAPKKRAAKKAAPAVENAAAEDVATDGAAEVPAEETAAAAPKRRAAKQAATAPAEDAGAAAEEPVAAPPKKRAAKKAAAVSAEDAAEEVAAAAPKQRATRKAAAAPTEDAAEDAAAAEAPAKRVTKPRTTKAAKAAAEPTGEGEADAVVESERESD